MQLAVNSNQAMMQVLDRDSNEIFVDFSLFFVASISPFTVVEVEPVWQTGHEYPPSLSTINKPRSSTEEREPDS